MQEKNKPFFLYIHFHGSHAPYKPPSPYRDMFLNDKFRRKPEFVPISTLNDRDNAYRGQGCIPFWVAENENNITDPNYYISQYDGAISYSDAQIGRLLNSLKKIGLDKNTLVVLTADHGEMLGEHNIYFNHAGGYEGGYEENIKVPLIIRLPKSLNKRKTVSCQVSLIDIAPTVLDAIGLDRPPYMVGESLLAFIKPFKTYSKKYVFCFFGEGDWIVLRTDGWKLIYCYLFKSWRLFDLKKDPKENYNLINDKPYKFKQLKQVFENLKRQITPSTPAKKGPPLTEKDKEYLRSLGYIQ